MQKGACSPSPSRGEAVCQLWGQGGDELGLGQGPWEQQELRKGSEGQGQAWSIRMRGWVSSRSLFDT